MTPGRELVRDLVESHLGGVPVGLKGGLKPRGHGGALPGPVACVGDLERGSGAKFFTPAITQFQF